MANYIGNVITPKVSSDHIAKVLVTADNGLKAGEVVVVEELVASIDGNYEVFIATKPATANLTSGNLAIVMNPDDEKLKDGRRVEGNPDYTTYEYRKGDVATVIFIDEHLTFEISQDSFGDETVDPTTNVKKYLIPQNGSYSLKLSEAPLAGGKCLKIITTRAFPVGGMIINGGGFVTTYICMAVHNNQAIISPTPTQNHSAGNTQQI